MMSFLGQTLRDGAREFVPGWIFSIKELSTHYQMLIETKLRIIFLLHFLSKFPIDKGF